MRKFVAVLFIIACMAYLAACGGSSSTSTNVTIYDLPTPVDRPSTRTVLGGSIQGGGALGLANPVTVTTIAGGVAGFSNISSVGAATFNRPIAVATDGTNLYVADYYNNVIRQINIVSKHVITIAGNGLIGSADGIGAAASFNRPTSITIVGTSLYVTDSGNYTIRKIDLSAGAAAAVVTTPLGGVGLAGSVDAVVGTNARFNFLSGITTDGSSLYVTDSNNTIRRILISTGAVSTLAGSPGTSGSVDGVQATARFNLPARITTDGPNLYVTDYGNSTIRKIALSTGTVTTIAGKVGPGGAAGSEADSTDGTGQTARFNQPNGITTDGVNLYVTDSFDNAVRKVVLSDGTVYSGPVSTLVNNGASTVNTTMGITTDGFKIYITDFSTDLPTGNLQHRIREIQ